MTNYSNSNINADRKIIKNEEVEKGRKNKHDYFKRQTGKIAHDKSWTWLRKGNLKRKTEVLLKAVQNNVRRTNYIKAKINNT